MGKDAPQGAFFILKIKNEKYAAANCRYWQRNAPQEVSVTRAHFLPLFRSPFLRLKGVRVNQKFLRKAFDFAKE